MRAEGIYDSVWSEGKEEKNVANIFLKKWYEISANGL